MPVIHDEVTDPIESQPRTAHASTPARLLLGLLAAVTGVTLVLVPLNSHQIAVITGLGIIITAAVLLLHDRRNQQGEASRLPRVFAVVLLIIGAAIAIAPSVSVAAVPLLIALALIAHGALSLVQALRSHSPYRVSDAIAACAGVAFGTLALLWPVLTLSLFRFAVGAWFVFFGLRLIFEILFRQGSHTAPGHRPTRLRQWARGIGSALALTLALLLVATSGVIFGGAKLPEPDEFYAAPTTAPTEPGRLIRTEPISVGVPDGAQAWKILYTTTHSDGSPAISSGTVIAPSERGTDPLPLLTVSHGTTGVAPKCAPSLSATPFSDGAGTALTEMVTQHGWVAVTSDYIGLGTSGPHPYLLGDAEARNVIDASRAVQDFDELSATTDTVVWGHSQGGQGALWTGQIAADYAPELSIKGVAAFAPASDLFGLAEVNKNGAAGKTVSAYIASTWNDIFPSMDLESHLTPGSARGVDRISDLCFNGSDVLGAILTGTQIPNQVFPDKLLAGEFGDRLKEQTPTGPWPAPVMVAQGLADPLVKPALQDSWVADRCTAGDPIDYRTFPGLDHNSLVAATSPLTPQIVSWTLDRWAGLPATPNCDGPK